MKHMWFPGLPERGALTMRCPCGKTWRCDRLEPKGECTRHQWLEAPRTAPTSEEQR